MTRTLLLRGVSACTLALAGSLASTWAHAQTGWPADAPPPLARSVDANGVDVTSGALTLSAAQASIGPGSGGLVRTQTNFSSEDNFYGAINSSGSTYTVSVGASSETFTGSPSGGFTSSQQTGSSLVYNSAQAVYVYTQSDGSVATFNPQYATAAPVAANVAQIVSYTKPTGESLSYYYHDYTQQYGSPKEPLYRETYWIQSITSNRGLQIAYGFNYSGSKTTPPTLASVQGANLSPSGSTGGTYSFSGSQVTDPLGRVTSYGVVAPSSTQTITKPSGSSKQITYDSSSRVTSVSDGVGTWTYSYSNGSTSVTDPNGNKTSYAISASGAVTSFTDGLGRVTTYQYDPNFPLRLIQTNTSRGDGYSYSYDGRGNIIKVVRLPATGASEGPLTLYQASYDASCGQASKCNEPNWTKDANGNETDYTYDTTNGTGLVTSITRPAGASGVRPQTRYTYSNLAANVRSGSGSVQAAPIWLLTQTSSCRTGSAPSCVGTADETRTTITYDPNQNLAPVSVTTAAGDGSISSSGSFNYDPLGNLYSSTSPLGGSTRYRYDADRELIGVVGPDPDGSGPLTPTAVELQYDGGGRLLYTFYGAVPSQSDSDWSNFINSYSYYDYYVYNSRDGLDNVRRSPRGQPNVNYTEYGYDNAGRLVCKAVRMNSAQFPNENLGACQLQPQLDSGPDQVTYYTYDAADELNKVTVGYGTPQQHDLYNVLSRYGSGEPLQVADGKGNVTTFDLDGYNRLFRTVYANPANGSQNTSDHEDIYHDGNGNLTYLRKRDGSTFNPSYDALNNLTTGVDGYTYAYDNYGHVVSGSAPSGTAASFTYDALGRTTSSTRPNIGTVSYAYDAAGDRTRLTWPDGFFVGYTYDVLGRMTAVQELGSTAADYHQIATYAYDSLGRRISSMRGATVSLNYAYDGVSRLSSISYSYPNASYNDFLQLQYNEAGAISWKQNTNASYDWTPSISYASISYGIDGLNRVTSAAGNTFAYDATGGNLSSDGTNSFSYDHYNRLTAANSEGANYDPMGNLWATWQGSTANEYLYAGSDMIGEYDVSYQLERRYIPGAGGEMVGWYEGGSNVSRRYLSSDYQNSVVSTVDASGNVLAVNSYDEWGMPGASNIGRHQFTGQAWMPEFGLYNLHARVYSPTLGRFLQTDPIGYGDGMNWYAYTHNDPVNGADPTGLDYHADVGGGVTRYCSASSGGSYDPSLDDGVGEYAVGSGPAEDCYDVGPDLGGFSGNSATSNSLNGTGKGLLSATPQKPFKRGNGFEICSAFGGTASDCSAVSNAMGAQSRFVGTSLISAVGVGVAGGAGLSAGGVLAATSVSPDGFTAAETVILRATFGSGPNGAQSVLDAIANGTADIPNSLTSDLLSRYGDVAQSAIDAGIDKLGTQALRLQIINALIGK